MGPHDQPPSRATDGAPGDARLFPPEPARTQVEGEADTPRHGPESGTEMPTALAHIKLDNVQDWINGLPGDTASRVPPSMICV